MFVFVRLIDSHGHQYPKKTRSNDPEKNQKQNPEKPCRSNIGKSKIQRKTESEKPIFAVKPKCTVINQLDENKIQNPY